MPCSDQAVLIPSIYEPVRIDLERTMNAIGGGFALICVNLFHRYAIVELLFLLVGEMSESVPCSKSRKSRDHEDAEFLDY